ncbi:FAD-dependent oxidoreductase [Planctomycetales bacterium ZRK34]|nr:FAD-dependent oxidoreductase [Planctomycetales bacterium ZRK34]
MRTLLIVTALLLPVGCSAVKANPAAGRQHDVVIYAATPGGIAAAISAAKSDCRVLLIEPTPRIGGLVTNGLTHPDFHAFEGLTGFYLEFTQRTEDYYRNKYGPDSDQLRISLRGTQTEPSVALTIFQQMLAEHPSITVLHNHTLASVSMTHRGRRIASIKLSDTDGSTSKIAAPMFIDASYEGDLMAAAGVPWRAGREGREEYDESLAPEQPDDQLQAYNFRLTMTQDPDNLAPVPLLPGYDRNDYLDLIPLLESGKVKQLFAYKPNAVYKAQIPPLPNGKYDINDVSRSIVRLSMPGENLGWPDGDAATRRAIFNKHLLYNVGMLYFLQHDEAVPQAFRDEANSWGLCKDELVENNHLPIQLYVREARRMIGQYVFTEHDTACAENDPRAVLHEDAIAMCEYSLNCHGTSHEGPLFGGHHTGEFYKAAAPYQIPYGVIVPKQVENLLVPVALSASHVGFCALRLEPCWSSLGQAAGFAAAQAIDSKQPVQQVDVPKLQTQLHEDGSATIYLGDVPHECGDFAAAQWWGTHGGFHGITPRTVKPGQRGKHIVGQYYESYPQHDAELDTPLDDTLRARWITLAKKLGVMNDKLKTAPTRRDFIRAAYASRS